MTSQLDKQAKLLGIRDWTYLPLSFIAQYYLDTYFNEVLLKKPHVVLYNVTRATRAKRGRGETPPFITSIDQVKRIADEKAR